MAKRNYKSLAKVFEYELPIKISKENGRFIAKCPSWSDCYAQGDSVGDVISETTAVAASLIELYREEGLEIPLWNEEKKRTCVIPHHKEISVGTLRSIIGQMGISRGEFLRL